MIASLWSALEKFSFSRANEVSSTRFTVSRRILLTEALLALMARRGPSAMRRAIAVATANVSSPATT
ncbi:hypothetical protein D3C78_1926570 [compost metagenome]